MKIGVIGAENSHTAAIAKLINIDKKVKGVTVDYVWGETDAFAKQAAEYGQIPNIVKKPKEMMDKIDALIVDHRHPKYHLKAALPFVERGIPTFVDKPFCYKSDEGKEFLKLAKKHKTPVTSFSVLPHQRSFVNFCRKLPEAGDILAATTYGPCDLRSEYGGVFFYGIHQVDIVLKAFGYNVSRVLVTKNGNGATGQMFYPNGFIVTMNFIKSGNNNFAVTAMGTKKILHSSLTYDKGVYLGGIKVFTKMFKTGLEPEKHAHMLKPVQVLEALQRSVKSGKIEKVLK